MKFWSLHFNALVFDWGIRNDTLVPLNGPEGKATARRTVVQPDGDILNLLPWMVLSADDFAPE